MSSTTLKKISIPQLNRTDFGRSLLEQFQNIDFNFQKLAAFSQGIPGKSCQYVTINLFAPFVWCTSEITGSGAEALGTPYDYNAFGDWRDNWLPQLRDKLDAKYTQLEEQLKEDYKKFYELTGFSQTMYARVAAGLLWGRSEFFSEDKDPTDLSLTGCIQNRYDEKALGGLETVYETEKITYYGNWMWEIYTSRCKKETATSIKVQQERYDLVLNHLRISTPGKLIISLTPEGDSYVPLDSLMYWYIDPRFRNGGTYTSNETYLDASCVLHWVAGKDGGVWTGAFSFFDLFPSIKLGEDGVYYWVINGVDTGIPVQGPAGKDGRPQQLAVVERIENVSGFDPIKYPSGKRAVSPVSGTQRIPVSAFGGGAQRARDIWVSNMQDLNSIYPGIEGNAVDFDKTKYENLTPVYDENYGKNRIIGFDINVEDDEAWLPKENGLGYNVAEANHLYRIYRLVGRERFWENTSKSKISDEDDFLDHKCDPSCDEFYGFGTPSTPTTNTTIQQIINDLDGQTAIVLPGPAYVWGRDDTAFWFATLKKIHSSDDPSSPAMLVAYCSPEEQITAKVDEHSFAGMMQRLDAYTYKSVGDGRNKPRGLMLPIGSIEAVSSNKEDIWASHIIHSDIGGFDGFDQLYEDPETRTTINTNRRGTQRAPLKKISNRRTYGGVIKIGEKQYDPAQWQEIVNKRILHIGSVNDFRALNYIPSNTDEDWFNGGVPGRKAVGNEGANYGTADFFGSYNGGKWWIGSELHIDEPVTITRYRDLHNKRVLLSVEGDTIIGARRHVNASGYKYNQRDGGLWVQSTLSAEAWERYVEQDDKLETIFNKDWFDGLKLQIRSSIFGDTSTEEDDEEDDDEEEAGVQVLSDLDTELPGIGVDPPATHAWWAAVVKEDDESTPIKHLDLEQGESVNLSFAKWPINPYSETDTYVSRIGDLIVPLTSIGKVETTDNTIDNITWRALLNGADFGSAPQDIVNITTADGGYLATVEWKGEGEVKIRVDVVFRSEDPDPACNSATYTFTVSCATGEEEPGGSEEQKPEEPKVTPVTSIKIPDSLELEPGETQTLCAEVFPANATNKTLKWKIIRLGSASTIRLEPSADTQSCKVTWNGGGQVAVCCQSVSDSIYSNNCRVTCEPEPEPEPEPDPGPEFARKTRYNGDHGIYKPDDGVLRAENESLTSSDPQRSYFSALYNDSVGAREFISQDGFVVYNPTAPDKRVKTVFSVDSLGNIQTEGREVRSNAERTAWFFHSRVSGKHNQLLFGTDRGTLADGVSEYFDNLNDDYVVEFGFGTGNKVGDKKEVTWAREKTYSFPAIMQLDADLVVLPGALVPSDGGKNNVSSWAVGEQRAKSFRRHENSNWAFLLDNGYSSVAAPAHTKSEGNTCADDGFTVKDQSPIILDIGSGYGDKRLVKFGYAGEVKYNASTNKLDVTSGDSAGDNKICLFGRFPESAACATSGKFDELFSSGSYNGGRWVMYSDGKIVNITFDVLLDYTHQIGDHKTWFSTNHQYRAYGITVSPTGNWCGCNSGNDATLDVPAPCTGVSFDGINQKYFPVIPVDVHIQAIQGHAANIGNMDSRGKNYAERWWGGNAGITFRLATVGPKEEEKLQLQVARAWAPTQMVGNTPGQHLYFTFTYPCADAIKDVGGVDVGSLDDVKKIFVAYYVVDTYGEKKYEYEETFVTEDGTEITDKKIHPYFSFSNDNIKNTNEPYGKQNDARWKEPSEVNEIELLIKKTTKEDGSEEDNTKYWAHGNSDAKYLLKVTWTGKGKKNDKDEWVPDGANANPYILPEEGDPTPYAWEVVDSADGGVQGPESIRQLEKFNYTDNDDKNLIISEENIDKWLNGTELEGILKNGDYSVNTVIQYNSGYANCVCKFKEGEINGVKKKLWSVYVEVWSDHVLKYKLNTPGAGPSNVTITHNPLDSSDANPQKITGKIRFTFVWNKDDVEVHEIWSISGTKIVEFE